MAAITLLQKLQKLFGVKAVSSMMGNTSNVRSLGQGINNSLSGTFSKKYLQKNPEALEEAAASILESLPYAFGTKDARQIKNFENNVNTLFDFKFPQSQSEGKVIDLGSKQQVTGKGLESLKNDMGLPPGTTPQSPIGKMQESLNRMNKMGKDMETKAESAGDIFMDLMKSSAPPVDRKKEGLVRTAAREFLNREIKLGKIKLQPDEIKSIIQPSGGGSDPIDILRTYYGEDSLEAFDGIANKFMNTEKYSDFNKIIDENIDPSFLKPRKDPTIKQSYSDQEMKNIVDEKKEDFATKLEDYDGDPDAMAEGGIAGQLYLNEGGRAAYGKGGFTRRAFLQAMGGAAATGAAFKTGLGGLIKTKGLSKIVTPTITKTAGMPDWFPALVKKAWTEGTDVTKTANPDKFKNGIVKRVEINGNSVDVTHSLDTGEVNVHVFGVNDIPSTQVKDIKSGNLSTAYDEGLDLTYYPADSKVIKDVEFFKGPDGFIHNLPIDKKKLTPEELKEIKQPSFQASEGQIRMEGKKDFTFDGVGVSLNETKSDLKSLELYAKDKKPSFKDSYRIEKKAKQNQEYMEDPYNSPEVQDQINYFPDQDIDDFAIGGRVGFFKGGPAAKAAMQYLIDTLVKKKSFSKTLLDNVLNQKDGEKLIQELYKKEIGKVPLTTADKAPIPESTVTRDMFKDANERFNTNIKDRASAKNNDLSGIDNLFDKDGVLDKDAVLRDITKSVAKTKKSKIVKSKQLTKDELEDFENEIGDALEAYDFDGTAADAERILKEQKDYMGKMYTEYKAGKLNPDESLAKALDEVGGNFTGDLKYDADVLASELAFQRGLIKEGGDLSDIVDQDTASKIYNEAYGSVSGQFLKNREIKKMQQFSEPTETLKSIKEKGTMDISDPTIADEFDKFLRENDPEGYKNLEQKIQLDNFDPKDRKGSAKGGLAGVLNI